MILDRIFGIEHRHSSGLVVTGAGVDQDATLKRVFGTWGQTQAGATINEETCMGLSAFYAGVRLLSSTPAALPLCVYRRTSEDGDKEIARETREYAVLHDRPNPVMTPIQYREIGQLFVLLWGRSLSYIERDNAGRLVGLWPMHTNEVRMDWHDGRKIYNITRVRDNDLFPKPPTTKIVLADTDVLDIGTFDGKSVVGRAREQLGESLAAQQFGAGFYGGGAQPYMALVSKKQLLPDAIEKLRENWSRKHGGSTRNIAVLEDEMDIKTIGMPLDDAQFLESRQFYVAEIARWLGVPPHKLYDLTRATFSNIEEQQLEFYENLMPHLVRWEQELHWKLFKESERNVYMVSHVVESLLRGNIEKRYAAYAQALQWGHMNRNEVRRRENLNSMGESGDVFMVPNNMIPSDMMGQITGGGIGGKPIAGEAGGFVATENQSGEPVDASVASGQPIQTAADLVLNGAQITAATALVTAVAQGDIPRNAGIGQLKILFNLTSEQAEEIMGSAGTSEPTTPNPNPLNNANQQAQDEPEADGKKQAARSALLEAVTIAIHKEVAEIRNAAKKPEAFASWLDTFYEKWPAKMHAKMDSAVIACRTLGVDVPENRLVEHHCRSNKEKLAKLSDAIKIKMPGWQEKIAAELDAWKKELPDNLTNSHFAEK